MVESLVDIAYRRLKREKNTNLDMVVVVIVVKYWSPF